MKKSFLALLLISITLLFASQYKQDPLEESKKRGKKIYEESCESCHMGQGEGIEGVFPPLAKSDYLMADKKRSIHQVIFGVNGKMTVNGVEYDGDMPAQGLNDQEVADVLNYIRNSWGNKGLIIKAEEVKAERAKKK